MLTNVLTVPKLQMPRITSSKSSINSPQLDLKLGSPDCPVFHSAGKPASIPDLPILRASRTILYEQQTSLHSSTNKFVSSITTCLLFGGEVSPHSPLYTGLILRP